MPPIDWRAVLPGAALSILLSIPGFALIGAAIGGLVAGALATRPRTDAVYAGAIVGVLTILGLAVLPVPQPTDTMLILAFDALLLAAATAAAWLASLTRRAS